MLSQLDISEAKKNQIRYLGMMMMMMIMRQKIIPKKNMLAIFASQMVFVGFKKMVISRSRAQRELQARGRVFVGVCGRPRFDLRKLQQLAVWSSFFVKDI